jgi:hypothetical protein
MSKTSSSPAGAPPKLNPRTAVAIARGELVRNKLAAENGSLSADRAAHLLGVSKSTLLRRWRRHCLVGWKRGRSVRFPVWQFSEGKVLEGVETVLRILNSDDQWRLMLYFLANRRSLCGRRVLDLLRDGKVAKVIEHAGINKAENTW